MSYLTQVAHQRPMLRVTAEIALVFCCRATGFGVFKPRGVRREPNDTLSRRRPTAAFSIPPRYVVFYFSWPTSSEWKPSPREKRHHDVRVSITATVPNKVMGRTRLGFMSPSPDLTLIWSVYHFKLKWRPPKIS